MSNNIFFDTYMTLKHLSEVTVSLNPILKYYSVKMGRKIINKTKHKRQPKHNRQPKHKRQPKHNI